MLQFSIALFKATNIFKASIKFISYFEMVNIIVKVCQTQLYYKGNGFECGLIVIRIAIYNW
jgi:hypothetical protein